MPKKAKKREIERPSYKAIAEGLTADTARQQADITRLEEELSAEMTRSAELESRVSELGASNQDLSSKNLVLERSLSDSRRKSRRLEDANLLLRSEVDSRRRLAGVLAIFHHAGTAVEDCYDEFRKTCEVVGVDIARIDRRHTAEAYKAAGRRLHKLTWEMALRMAPSRVGRAEPKDPVDETIRSLEHLLGLRDRG